MGIRINACMTAFAGALAIGQAGPAHALQIGLKGNPGELATENDVEASESLTLNDFWAVIDHSAKFEADPEMQLADLRASLLRMTPDQIEAYEHLFDQTMRASYTWDLWGAAYIANGGASDDGFEYFRCWLISKGHGIFEKVSANPDSLVDLIAEGEPRGDFEFEEFAYVARDAWAEKTGRNWNEMPTIADMMYDEQPAGIAFNADPEELQRRYPRLWHRFGR